TMPRIFKVVSVAIHGIVITIVSYGQLFDPGLLPTPRSVLAFETTPIVVEEIQAPPVQRTMPPSSSPAVSLNAAPIVEPSAILPETGRENEAVQSAVRGVLDGAVGGVGDLGNIGVVNGPPPPPQEQTPPKPIPVGGDVRPPRKIWNVDPIYPPLAQASRKEGMVILEAIVDVKGNVESVRVLRGVQLLDQAAV